jgi:hypothetical protein
MQAKSNWGIGWMIAFLGFPPGGLLASVLIGRLDDPLEGIIGGVAAGILIGTAQTLALRRRLPVDPEWVAATAAGLVVGVSLSVALFGSDTSLNATLMRAPLTGLMIGIAQWLVLRKHVPQAFWWIPTVAVVYVIAWFVTAQVLQDSLDQGFIVFGASGALVFQALTGTVLMLLLRSNVSKLALS